MTFQKLSTYTASTVVWIHNALCHFNPLGYGKRMIKPGQFWCINVGHCKCDDLANSCHGSSESSTSPWVWQLLAKSKCVTWPVCDGVEEQLICCGDFSILGGGLGLLLNFCMPLVELNTRFLIVLHPILFTFVVLTAFLFGRMDLDQHRCLNFGCAPLGCWDVDCSAFSRACVGIWPTVVMEAVNVPHLHEFGSC